MQLKEFVHPKYPSLFIFWILHISIKSRWLCFLKFIWQVSPITPLVRMITMIIMMHVRTRNRIVPLLITPPIRSVQQPTIFLRVNFIWPVSTRRPIAICPISSILLSMGDPKRPLSLQFWQNLKEYCINLYLIIFFLYDPVIIYLKTPYLFFQSSQSVCQIRRVPTTLLIWFIGRVLLVYHLAIHFDLLPTRHNMLDKPNHNKLAYLSTIWWGYLICKIIQISIVHV